MQNAGKYARQDSNKNSQRTPSKELTENSKTERVQNTVQNSQTSPELKHIIATWPSLPEHIKKAIVTLTQK